MKIYTITCAVGLLVLTYFQAFISSHAVEGNQFIRKDGRSLDGLHGSCGHTSLKCFDWLNFLHFSCDSIIAKSVCDGKLSLIAPYRSCFECCQATFVTFGDSLTDSGEDSAGESGAFSFQELLETAWGEEEVDWETEYSQSQYHRGSFVNSPGTWSAQIGNVGHAKEINYAYGAAELRDKSEFFSIKNPLFPFPNPLIGFGHPSNTSDPPTETCLDPRKNNCQFYYIDPEEKDPASGYDPYSDGFNPLNLVLQQIPDASGQVQQFINSNTYDAIRNTGRAAVVLFSFGGNDFQTYLRRATEDDLEPYDPNQFAVELIGAQIQAVFQLKVAYPSLPVIITGLLPLHESPGFQFSVNYDQGLIAQFQTSILGINAGLQNTIASYVANGQLNGVHYVDVYSFYYSVADQFSVPNYPCALGPYCTFWYNNQIPELCTVCTDPENHIWWDAIHPSAAFHNLVAQFIKETTNDLLGSEGSPFVIDNDQFPGCDEESDIDSAGVGRILMQNIQESTTQHAADIVLGVSGILIGIGAVLFMRRDKNEEAVKVSSDCSAV